jgi:putative methionine-R-sulfoxide reductase with GAF domain
LTPERENCKGSAEGEFLFVGSIVSYTQSLVVHHYLWSFDNAGREHPQTVGELLSTMLERAIFATQATGGAIALTAGKELLCVAAQGTAPDVGTHFAAQFGFSGRCVRTRRMLLCDDSEIDPRVDRAACRQLRARSIIALPLCDRRNMVGILELLSTSINAFDGNDIRELTGVADSIVKVLAETRPAHAKSRVVAV